jgi:hypothetical protein
MSKFYLQHPEVDQLLAFSDGELRGLAATRVRRHLKDCWHCRTQLEDLQATVTGFMRYKERVLETHLPEPPAGWRNLKLEFERIDRTVPAPRFGDRMVARYGTPAIRVASVAAILAVTGLGFVVVRQFESMTPKPAVTSASGDPAVTSPRSQSPALPDRMVPQPATQAHRYGNPDNPVPASKGNAEVKVVAALHKLGADLGEPIEFVRDAQGRIVVTATALGSARRAQVQQALSSIDGVELKFEEGRPARNPARALALVEGGRLPWQTELEQILGTRASVENFGNTVLDLSDSIVARAHALKNLDERFAAAQLDPAERAQVDQITAEHRAEMAKSAVDLKKRMVPILAKLGTGISTSNKWPLLTAAQQTDQWLNVLFAGAATDRNLEQVAAELGRSLGSLED